MDYSAIAEEIALEGLDGITLNALWVRLENRPGFTDVNLDDDFKRFVWRYVCQVKDFTFYCLPEARPELVIFKYSSYIISEACKCIFTDDIPPDIYSCRIVDRDGVKGCCDNYESRRNVTGEVRSSDGSQLMSLEEITERWGQSFVVVASQRQRNLVLMGSTSCPVVMGLEIYCILEAVGRSRHEGEITQCRYSRGLSNLKTNDSGKAVNVFAGVKTLSKYGFIRKQPFAVRYNLPGSNIQVRLVHLRKYYKATMANLRGYMIILTNFLMSKPNRMALYTDVVKLLKLSFSLFKKPARFLHEHFTTEMVDSHEVFPNAKDNKTKKGDFKRVRVVKLLKPYHDEEVNDDDDDNDDEDGDEFEDGEDAHKMDADTSDNKLEDMDKDLGKKKSDYGNLTLTQPVMHQAVRHVVASGETGLLQRELLYKLNLDKNVVRCCVRELLKMKAIAIVKRARGKNHAHVLVSPEVAEVLGKYRKTYDLLPEPVANTDVAVETSPVSEEAESCPSGEQPPTIHVQEIEFDLTNISVICTIDRAEHPVKSLSAKEVNDRKLARKKFILKRLSERKIVGYIRNLFYEMCEEEKRHGIREQMCRKSFKRILKELYNEGQIAYVNIHDKRNPEKVLHQMLIDSKISLLDNKIHEALVLSSPHFVKLDSKATLAEKKVDPIKSEPAEVSSSPSAENSDSTVAHASEPSGSKKTTTTSMVSVCQMLDRNKKSAAEKKANDVVITKRGLYCQVPKFERAKQLHMYLYYLLYEYEGSLDVPSQESMGQGSSDTPPVYLDVDNWRRHLPPLKKHNESFLAGVPMDGVCMTGDILLNMPLILFCNIISIPWEVEGLAELLKDPVRRNYPITFTPQSMLSRLMRRRVYLLKLNESLLLLCHLGLLSFGTKTASRELEFISFYLHKKAMVLDTRKSEPGCYTTRCPEGETFQELHYCFNTMDDVINYWNDIKVIGLNSKLGSYSVDDVKGIHGTVSLMDASQPIPLKEVNEDSWLPGDRRGAVGFDSSLFIHRNNNWTVKTSRTQHKSSVAILTAESKESESLTLGTETETVTKPIHEGPPVKKRRVARTAQSYGTGKFLKKNPRKRKPLKKKEKPVAKRSRVSAIVDDIDRQAKLNMRRQRSYFTPLENGLLLLSQIASCMLSPRSGSCVKSTLVRNILQEFYPGAKDKTSSAVKGKTARLLKDEKFRAHLVTYMSQAISDKDLMKKYQGKKPTIHSKEMEKLFCQLFRDLWKKFSLQNSESLFLPSTLDELENEYEVKYTKDLLFKNPKVTKDVQCVDDVKEVVVWELLESFLHLTNPLIGGSVYYTLSRFPDDVIHRVFSNLKACGVFIQMKKPEKDRSQIINKSALLNNHRSTLRHKEAMKQRYPVDLFRNIKHQIEALIKMKPTESTSSSDGRINLPAVSRQALENTESSENLHTPMETEESHRLESECGASSVNAQPTENVAEKSAVQHHLPRSSELDVNTENHFEPSFEKLELHKYHGGTVLTVLSLLAMDLLKVKVVIPDEMVKLDEEGKRKLYFKKPTVSQPLKRKHDDFADSDEEADVWQSADSDIATHQHRSGQRQRGGCSRGLKYPRSELKTAKNSIPMFTDSSSQPGLREIEKSVELKDVTLKMRILNTAASDVLDNFTVWVASGSLLTIARTSLIESLDLLNSKCLLQRNFIVEPLGIDCALKPEAFHKPETDKNRAVKNPVSATERRHFNDEAVSGIASSHSDVQKPRSNVDKGSVTVDGPSSRCTNNKNARSWYPEESYTDLLHHLEKCISPEVFNEDIRQQLPELIPPESLDTGLNLFDVINSSGDLGITEADLEYKLQATMCQMKPLLRILIRADAIFKVGGVQRRYVSRHHAKVWLVEVPVSKSGETQLSGRECVLYQCHLWRHLSGSLNWEGLQSLLQRIITYLMANPGCSLGKLTHMLNPDVLPATTVDAIDILEEIGCVELKRLQKPAQCTLFSSRRRGLARGDNIKIDESLTVIDVLIDAPIKLAYFLDLAIQYCQRK
ncbi:hypothetical protein BsWGS_11404 [Bradybaena similaris]